MKYPSHIPLPGSHQLALHQAITLVDNYRHRKESILAPAFRHLQILPVSEIFNRADIDHLLFQEDVAAVRLYYGMDETHKIHTILVGVNDKNEDTIFLAANGSLTINEEERNILKASRNE